MRQGLLSVSTHCGIIDYLINISFIFLLSKGSPKHVFLKFSSSLYQKSIFFKIHCIERKIYLFKG